MGKDLIQKVKMIEHLLSDNEIVKFDNDSMELKKLRELESSFKFKEKDFKNLLVFWDDLIQFTTLGLIELLLESFTDIENKEWDFDNYFYRGYENSDYIKFIIGLFEKNWNKTLTPEFISEFHKANYEKILLNSPATTLFPTIVRCEALYRSVTFVFRYKFEGMDKFADSTKTGHFTGRFNFPVKTMYMLDVDTEREFLLKNGKDYDILMIQNLGRAIEYIDKSKHRGLALVSPYGHNGVHQDFFNVYAGLFGANNKGPYNSEITIFNEGIAVC